MFTGIIRGIGRVSALRRRGAGARLLVTGGRLSRGIRPGDSVAVNGVCLTVAAGASRRDSVPRLRPGTVAFDLVGETLDRTTLGALRRGQRVNLERALRYGDALGGHLVTGHVDGVGRIRTVRDREPEVLRRRQEHAEKAGGPAGGREVTIEPVPPLPGPRVAKGSVAVDGVSLTVAAVGPGWFRVVLIPETIRRTTLGGWRPGDVVNIELDREAREAARGPGRVTWRLLRRGGYR